jgi:hypothetical protein
VADLNPIKKGASLLFYLNVSLKQITVFFCFIFIELARSKAWVCGRSQAGVAGSNPAGSSGCLSPVSVVCFG